MLMQNLGGQTKSIMVFSDVGYSSHLTIGCAHLICAAICRQPCSDPCLEEYC